MTLLPYWPRRASLSYNLCAYAALWSWTAFVLGLVGGSTAKWVRASVRDAQLSVLQPC